MNLYLWIQQWRKDNNLNYPGWWRFVLKRWLINHGVGFLVPFQVVKCEYKDRIVRLITYRWGVCRQEMWKWHEARDIDISDRLCRLRELGTLTYNTFTKTSLMVLIDRRKRLS